MSPSGDWHAGIFERARAKVVPRGFGIEGIEFSADDGKTWTEPAVIARAKKGWIAYPYLFEARPGELWITTMQGGLRVGLREQDFVGKPKE